MKRTDPIWSELNNLLAQLHDLNVVELVEQHYAKFNNPAPPQILTRSIEKLQRRLDESEQETPMKNQVIAGLLASLRREVENLRDSNYKQEALGSLNSFEAAVVRADDDRMWNPPGKAVVRNAQGQVTGLQG